MAESKQAKQKPPTGYVFSTDYANDDGSDYIPGIASRLGITYGRYRKWRMAGKGPDTFMLGKRVAARISVVDAWIAEQERIALEPLEEERPPEAKTPSVSHGRPRRTKTATSAA